MTEIRDSRVYLEDILEAVRHALRFAESLNFEQFHTDVRTIYAVSRALEIVGEAAKSIPESVRILAPEIPWQEMAGMRDKLIHGYQGVDLRVLWRTVQEDLPDLLASVSRLLDQLDSS